MRRSLFIAIWILFLSTMFIVSYGDIPTVQAGDTSCSDSDASVKFPYGNNIFVKGTLTRNGILPTDPVQTDVCTSSTTLQESSCNGTNWNLGYHTCTHGCVDGACIVPPPTCQEFDGGNAPNTVSFAQMFSDAVGAYGKKQDMCDGNILKEQYCATSNEMIEVTHTCPYGCYQGSCAPAGTTSSTTSSASSSSSAPICTGDERVCPDGTTVKRDPRLECEFQSCPYVQRTSSSRSSIAPSSLSSSASSQAPTLTAPQRAQTKRCMRFNEARRKRIKQCAKLGSL